MPDADPDHPDAERTRAARAAQRVAWIALVGVCAIMLLKFAVFALTNSAAVLSDAMESVINVAAAAMAAFSTWYAARPADREHPYGHGKVEFVAVGVEGAMIAIAAIVIVVEAARRWWGGIAPIRLEVGAAALLGVNVLLAALAAYILINGRRLRSPTLLADGRHLMVDAATTAAIVLTMVLIRATGWLWLDPLIAVLMAAAILAAGVRLVRQSWGGLMDEIDPADDRAIRALLDEEVAAGAILSYHKVRHRHSGAYHWVDLHLQVPAEMAVGDAHAEVSRIEGRIEKLLGDANATAHIEPPLDHPSTSGPDESARC